MADDPFRAEAIAVLGDLRSSVVFLTRLPASLFGAEAAAKPDFSRSARVFPIIGAAIGMVGGAVIVVASTLGEGPLIAIGLAIVATMALTGGLHEDGLADTADGFGGGETPERRLEIMSDSRIGTFGAAALIFSILFRIGALSSIGVGGSFRAAWVLVAAEAVSRAAMVGYWRALPAARSSGLGQETGTPDQPAMLIALAIAALIALATVIPTVGFTAVIVGGLIAAAATYAFTRISASAIGGRTGDTLGACQQIAATTFLIGVAALA